MVPKSCFETKWTAESSGHLNCTAHAVWRVSDSELFNISVHGHCGLPLLAAREILSHFETPEWLCVLGELSLWSWAHTSGCIVVLYVRIRGHKGNEKQIRKGWVINAIFSDMYRILIIIIFWMIEIFANELLNCLDWDWDYRHNQNRKWWILNTVRVSTTCVEMGELLLVDEIGKAAVESKDSGS